MTFLVHCNSICSNVPFWPTSGQVEKVHKNGTKQIIYGDGQQRLIKPDKSEELVLSDGRVFSISDDYEKIEYQNGDVELKTSAFTVSSCSGLN